MSEILKDNKINQIYDPHFLQEPIDISRVDGKAELIDMLKSMLIIRYSEEKISDNVENGTIKCPAHLGIGQEAIAVGIASQLNSSDRVFGTHRGHPPYLAMGGSVYELFAEVLGKVDGCSKGMGGSQHLYFDKNGHYFSVPIVSGTVPIAVGAALAAKMDGDQAVSVCFFGDGALEEGTVQESLNLAKIQNLPVIFVCENNMFASHMYILQRQPDKSVARYADAHQINKAIVDGNDVVALGLVAKNAIATARETGEPFFIEAITYRWKGHVGHREDMDVGVKRNKDLVLWKSRDPIGRLEVSLLNHHIVSEKELDQIHNGIKAMIEEEWLKAFEAPFPELTALEKLVYFSNKNKDE